MHFIAVITDKKLKADYKIYICGSLFFKFSDKPLYGFNLKLEAFFKKPARETICTSHIFTVLLWNLVMDGDFRSD